MKKRVYLIITIVMTGIASFAAMPTQVQAEPGKCDTVYPNKKKQFFVSGCKPKEGYLCLLRCDQPNMPTISL